MCGKTTQGQEHREMETPKVILGAGYQGMSPLQNFEPDKDDFTDRYGCACVHMHRHAYLYTDTGMCI